MTTAFFEGKKVDSHELSPYVLEHILARNYGWDLDKIRNMDLRDFYIHLRICLVHEKVDYEFKAMLAGATNKKSSGFKKPDNNVRGSITQTVKESIMKF